METKFKKVMTTDRMPIEEKFYFVKEKDVNNWSGYYFIPTNTFISLEFKKDIECWLEETIDREEELANLLQDAINIIDELPYDSKLQSTRDNLCMNAQSLIFDVKNNAPNLLD